MGGSQSPNPSGGFTLPSTLAPHCPHLALATPAGPHLLAMPLALHPSPLPTEYEQQPAVVPSMEKKRTVYQMALSKKTQHDALVPSSRPQPLGKLHAFCPPPSHVPSVTHELGTQGPGTPGTTYRHVATYSPVLCHPWAVPAGLVSPHRDRDGTM